MARFMRQASQLARVARLSQLQAAASRRSGFQVTRIAAGHARLPQTSYALRQHARLYSTRPPEPPKDESKPDGKEDKNLKKETEAEEDTKSEISFQDNMRQKYPLPEGWYYPSEQDYEVWRQVASNPMMPKAQKESLEEMITHMKLLGAPNELKEVIQKLSSGRITLGDIAKVLRVSGMIAARFAEVDVKEGETLEKFVDKKKHQQHQQDGQESAEESDAKQGQRRSSGQRQAGGDQEPGPQDFWTRKWLFGRFSNMDVAVAAFVWFLLVPMFDSAFFGQSKEITWQELRRDFLDKGLVTKLTVLRDRVRVDIDREAARAVYGEGAAGLNNQVAYYFSIGSIESFEKKLEQAQDELGIPASERIPVSYATTGGLTSFLSNFGPTLLLIGLTWWLMRGVGGRGGGSQVFGFGKSRAKRFNHETAIKVKFADVAGMDEAKTEIMEFVSFLKTPERFERLGAKIPRGAILSGPPGTGKTLLAKATAGESGVPFFSVSGSEFVEMFVGVGPSRVRDLFATARKNAPCIIFIDEIDAIGRSRQDSRMPGSGGNDEREATLNQILTEMDGFNTTEQVVVLAGTNRADILDKALMRPGRFDRHIYIDRPTMKGRQEIFRVHLKKIVTKEEMDHLTGRLATLTPGFSGADIANCVNEAALVAARANATSVELIHFEQAIERVIGGLERKSMVLKPEEKRTVAYHEAGHAICGWFFQFADPLLKVSIIPRGQGALGYAQYLPQGDAYLMTTQQLMDRMAMTLGGRVSEELHFPTVTTGASDDFKKVTQMARAMVTQWGMSEKVGPLHFDNNPNQFQKPFAEATAQAIDSEVHRIIEAAYQQCKDLLTAKKHEIGLVAEELLRKEVLTRDDLVRLLGPRQWGHDQEFEKYFGGESGGKSAPPPFPTEETDSPPPTDGPAPAAPFKGLDR